MLSLLQLGHLSVDEGSRLVRRAFCEILAPLFGIRFTIALTACCATARAWGSVSVRLLHVVNPSVGGQQQYWLSSYVVGVRRSDLWWPTDKKMSLDMQVSLMPAAAV
jgi:hypothetical protein